MRSSSVCCRECHLSEVRAKEKRTGEHEKAGQTTKGRSGASINWLDEELECTMDAGDVDQDGTINYEEFITSASRLRQSKKDDTLT